MELDKDDQLDLLMIEPNDEAYFRYSGLLSIWFSGYLRIKRAATLAEGIALLNSGAYQCAIADVVFPEAPDAKTNIKGLLGEAGAGDTPIVLLASVDEPALPLFALREGAAEYFTRAGLDKNLFEYRMRNLLQREFRARILQNQIGESVQRFQRAQGLTQNEIADLNEMVRAMKLELEGEYENKIALEKEKNRMQQVFGMYVDPKVVDAILKNELDVEQKGVQQEITVLFADIRGYTTLAERMRPEDVIAFLNTYFTAMTEVIMGYGGMIDKYIGDGIMTLFGAPVYEPEHRENALQTAMEMQMVFELWQPRWETNFGIRPAMGVGLASGMAVVGNVGSFQKISYTAVGDIVNMAARLESLAAGGEVLIPEDFYEKLSPELREKYTYSARDPVEIKGKSGRYHIYSVTYPV